MLQPSFHSRGNSLGKGCIDSEDRSAPELVLLILAQCCLHTSPLWCRMHAFTCVHTCSQHARAHTEAHCTHKHTPHIQTHSPHMQTHTHRTCAHAHRTGTHSLHRHTPAQCTCEHMLIAHVHTRPLHRYTHILIRADLRAHTAKGDVFFLFNFLF